LAAVALAQYKVDQERTAEDARRNIKVEKVVKAPQNLPSDRQPSQQEEGDHSRRSTGTSI